jgi:2-C-methyl-D-erythritol 2,4-cyclodiphosphate synthase
VIRVGIGYDSHRFGAARPLVLGGVEIPGAPGLIGHSDADAIAHALIDALLGAAALGDIGGHFPDRSEEWRDADSIELLRRTIELLSRHGWRPNQCDITVILERPKLGPHVAAIRERLAASMDVHVDAVSVKAKTNETMGFVGRGEGIAVHAVATILPVG